MHSEQAIDCVEVLCGRGCAAVRAVIAAMEAGCFPVETEGLTDSQRQFVLAELKSIMAVYNDRPCPVPAPAPAAPAPARAAHKPRRAYARALAIA